MLTKFDWLRRSRTGSELLTTLKCFATKPNYEAEQPASTEILNGGT